VSSFALKQISEFATAHDLYLTGHVPLGVTSVAAIDAGMKILEHVRVHPQEILDDPAEVAEYPLDLVVMRRTGDWSLFKPDGRAVTRTLDEWQKRKDRFFLDPTLAVQEALARADEPAVKDGRGLGLISPAMRQNWPAGTRQYGDLSPQERLRAKGSVQGMIAFVGLAHKRGIRILSGTDTPVPYTIPGVSLLRELELLVKAGLTPVEAIHSSTGGAAEALRNKTRGVVAAGQEADLIVVDGNAAADIAAVQRIERVVIGGRIYDRARLLEEAATLAAAHQGRTFPGAIN
jgi:imidazolonepropionase-like amidohydrolase